MRSTFFEFSSFWEVISTVALVAFAIAFTIRSFRDRKARESAETPPSENGFRDKFASRVFMVSGIGILLIAVLCLIPWSGGRLMEPREVFLGIVPLLGTWVGTLMAFYFSRENFESASASLRQVVDRLTPEQRLKGTAVKDVWTSRKGMTVLSMAGKTEKDITVRDLCKAMVPDKITRIPILADGDLAKYVIHESILNKFIAATYSNPPAAGAAGAPPAAVDPLSKTLEELLNHRSGAGTLRDVVSAIAFVRSDGSLADAQERMNAVKGSQDVFATKSGTAKDAVDGWITNADIAKVVSL